MKDKTRLSVITAGCVLTTLGLGVLGVRSCNNYSTNTPNYTSISEPASIMGSVEYTEFKDGSEEILVTEHSLRTHTILYQNLDGDDKIDRIRFDVSGAGRNFHLEKLLVRSVDFESNKELFNQAERLLLKYRERKKKN